MLEVKNLYCSYGSMEVLKNVDFKVDNGEVVAVIGSSGSGKTTLLRCLSFLNKANSGTIIFDDFEKDITRLKKNDIMKSTYILEYYHIMVTTLKFKYV